MRILSFSAIFNLLANGMGLQVYLYCVHRLVGPVGGAAFFNAASVWWQSVISFLDVKVNNIDRTIMKLNLLFIIYLSYETVVFLTVLAPFTTLFYRRG